MYKFPMNLHTNSFCKQLRYCLRNNINNTIRLCCHTSNNKQQNVPPTTCSIKFPDYKLIYKFPYITHALLLNKLKRNYTFFTGALIPITITAQMFDIISANDNILFTSVNCLIALSLHTISYLSNNSIGSICYKDNQDIIISYINYWGDRMDLKTTTDDIIYLSEDNFEAPKYLYRKLNIQSCKHSLKLYVKYGKVTDASTFSSLFGNLE